VSWKDIGSLVQNRVITHEIGHQLGMVTDGSGKLPDKVPTLYTGRGHIGNHCRAGLHLRSDYSSLSGGCVMFGSANTKDHFCRHCVVALKKLDLSKGVQKDNLSEGGLK